MRDPYEVLGIQRGASDEEIKRAYRTLSRRFHPDNNLDNPNKEEAERKFKEVQQAYQQILKEKENPGTYGSYQERSDYGNGYGSFGEYQERYGNPFGNYGNPFGGFSSRTREDMEDPHLKAAANYVNSGYYREALHVLSSIEHRTGWWYYYHAVANSGLGNNIDALEDARKAVKLEPSNSQFQSLLQRFERGNQWYEQQTSPYKTFPTDMSSCCWQIFMINLCCGGCGSCGGRGGFFFC